MEYKLIPKSEFNNVLFHYQKASVDEPTNLALNLKEIPSEIAIEDLKILKDGVSLKAVDSSNYQIVGIALNGISTRGDLESFEFSKCNHTLMFRQIYGLVYEINKGADLFNKYDVDKIFDLKMLCVEHEHRRKGIARELFSRSISLAEELGFKVDCSSYYTQKMAEKFGLKTENAIKFTEFQDENGGLPFKNSKPPHNFYKVMTIELPRKIV